MKFHIYIGGGHIDIEPYHVFRMCLIALAPN
jgi:hypothetical protein